jgi:magnesium chelatase subunit H
LLAEAALLAATADEPPAQNFIRKHALALQAAQGATIEEAALRVFGNADGAYGANVNQILNAGAWNDEDELAEAYVRRKGYAYGVDGKPHRHDAVLSHLLMDVDVTYQNLDSVELGVTTVDHYFDTLGGITRAVKRARGTDAAVYIGDQTRGDGTVRTLAEQVSLETRTRALNPKWYEALLAHGYEGVRQIEAQVTNTLGWSATTGQVAPWVYQQLAQTYMLDPCGSAWRPSIQSPRRRSPTGCWKPTIDATGHPIRTRWTGCAKPATNWRIGWKASAQWVFRRELRHDSGDTTSDTQSCRSYRA